MGLFQYYECDVCGQRRDLTNDGLEDLLDAGWRVLDIKWGAMREEYYVCPKCSDIAVHLPRPWGSTRAMRPLNPAFSKLEASE